MKKNGKSKKITKETLTIIVVSVITTVLTRIAIAVLEALL